MEGTEGHGGKRDRRVARERAIFGRSSAVGTCHGEREKKRRVPRAHIHTLLRNGAAADARKGREREREREDTRERGNRKEKEREKEAWQTAYRART